MTGYPQGLPVGFYACFAAAGIDPAVLFVSIKAGSVSSAASGKCLRMLIYDDGKLIILYIIIPTKSTIDKPR